MQELIQLHLCGSFDEHGREDSWKSALVSALPISQLADLKQEDRESMAKCALCPCSGKEIAKFVPIKKDTISSFKHESTVTKIYHWIMAYLETSLNFTHERSPQRREPGLRSFLHQAKESKGYLSYTRVNARILTCELLKEWAYEHRHCSDREMDLHVMCRYKERPGSFVLFLPACQPDLASQVCGPSAVLPRQVVSFSGTRHTEVLRPCSTGSGRKANTVPRAPEYWESPMVSYVASGRRRAGVSIGLLRLVASTDSHHDWRRPL